MLIWMLLCSSVCRVVILINIPKLGWRDVKLWCASLFQSSNTSLCIHLSSVVHYTLFWSGPWWRYALPRKPSKSNYREIFWWWLLRASFVKIHSKHFALSWLQTDTQTHENIPSFIFVGIHQSVDRIGKRLTLTLPGPSAGVSGSLDSYCSLKPLCSGMREVVLARTSPTLLPPSLALCCHYPVSKCLSASIVVTSTVRVKQLEY